MYVHIATKTTHHFPGCQQIIPVHVFRAALLIASNPYIISPFTFPITFPKSKAPWWPPFSFCDAPLYLSTKQILWKVLITSFPPPPSQLYRGLDHFLKSNLIAHPLLPTTPRFHFDHRKTHITYIYQRRYSFHKCPFTNVCLVHLGHELINKWIDLVTPYSSILILQCDSR